MKQLLLILMLGVFVLLSACKKDTANGSRTDLLTARSWKFVYAEVSTNNSPWEDEARFWPSCEKDDELRFYTDGHYELTEGATKCDPFDPELIEDDRWMLLENETALDMGGAVTTIQKLDQNELILYATYSANGSSSRYRYTLRH